MDFTLGKEHEMARTLFHDFAEKEVKPLAQEVDEEERFPVETVEKQGKITFSCSIMNPDLPVLKRLFGGEIASDVWSYPDAVNTVEESIIILPKKGLKFQVPRMKLVAKINGEFSKKGLLLIEVTGTVMKPTTSGLKKMAVGKVSASTASVSS